MDFSTRPPEVVSALIESGPGAESFLAASDAWQQLGSGLEDAAGNSAAVVSTLADEWSGPSSVAMTRAVGPYLSWLRATALQCQQTAASAQTAAAAFTAARTGVVPLVEVTANRTQLARLLATNGFGTNLPAIAQTEDEYQSMWASNTAVMNRYQTASAQAATLPQLSSPAAVANSTGVAAQSSATATAAANPADPVSDALSSLVNFDPTTGVFGFFDTYANQAVAGGFPINLLSYLAQFQQAQAFQGLSDVGKGLSLGSTAEAAANSIRAVTPVPTTAPTAAMGTGVLLGKLTAPPAVVGVLPATQMQVQLASAATPLSAEESLLDMLPPLMPPPISAGSGWRKRQQPQQRYDESEDEEYEEYDPYERPPSQMEAPPPQTPGSGWRKRANYDDIELGAQLPRKVVQKPPWGG